MIAAEIVEAFTTLLPPHECGLFITHNEHRDYYQTAEQYLAEFGRECVSPEERQRCIDTDEVWGLQWYPITPVGSYSVHASTLMACLAAANTVRQ